MFKITLYIFALGIFLSSCHKDYESGEEVTTSQFLPEIKSQVEGSILGYVYDEFNQPIEGALVEIYGATTRSDKYGVFEFQKNALDQHGTYIRISKAGYMTGSDKVFPSKGTLYSRVKLFSLHKNTTLSGESGGEVEIENGGKLIFPPLGIMDQKGEDFKGKIYVTAKFLSPLNPDLADEMPGSLLGGNVSGISSVLGTAGMFAVDLRDENGNKLQVKTGSKVKFLIPALSKNKPSTIALWHFDNNRGYWIEEGEAKLEGGFYIGEVSHFSFWNCDAPFPLVEICGSIVSMDDKPLAGVKIIIEVEGLGVASGYADLEGHFCGKVPRNKKLKLTIKEHGCVGALKELEIGPFSTHTVLNPIIVDGNYVLVTGIVSCNNVPVNNGIVIYTYGENSTPILADENGRYTFRIYKCGGLEELTIFAYDKETFKTSGTKAVSLSNATTFDLDVCNQNCVIDGGISYKCSYLEMLITQGSGQYRFLWSTGDSTSKTGTVLPINPTLICVTVQDVNIAGCEQIFCHEYKGTLKINIETECRNPLMIFPNGGVEPYLYLWHNGQTTHDVILTPGENYCVTVTDKVGCSVVKCGLFEGMTLSNTISNCNKHTFDISSSTFQTAKLQKAGGTIVTLLSLTGINIFESGFNFFITLTNNQCNAYQQYQLPQYKGLTIKGVDNTTCMGCTDGFIEIGINPTADCFNCIQGGVKILNIHDLNADLNNLNNMRLMPKGEYYVVVEDLNTNCYIAFEKVKVE